MTATWPAEADQTLLRPTLNELTYAPELGVLAALNAARPPPPTGSWPSSPTLP
jgi:hypothetical protein